MTNFSVISYFLCSPLAKSHEKLYFCYTDYPNIVTKKSIPQ